MTPENGNSNKEKGTFQRPSRSSGGSRDIQNPVLTEEMIRNMPASPEEIRSLLSKVRAVEKARNYRPDVTIPQKMFTVSLKPGASIKTVPLTTGYLTPLVLVDQNGNPWDIRQYSVGNKEDFSVQPLNAQEEEGEDGKQAGSYHTLLAMANSLGAQTNIVLKLADVPTPINVRLTSKDTYAIGKATLQVPKRGPNSSVPVVNNGGEAGGDRISTDSTMIQFVQGVPPSGAKTLVPNQSIDLMGWTYQDKLYVRTTVPVRNPGPQDELGGEGDVTVYRYDDGSLRELLVNMNNRLQSVGLSRPEVTIENESG